jgi:rhodanese-related sulfurtransferase
VFFLSFNNHFPIGGLFSTASLRLKEYDAGHLPGALSFPYAHRDEAFQEWASILNPEQKVLVYCSGKLCDDGLHLAIFLKGMGIKDVALFVDGLDGWKKAGLAVE